MVPSANRRRAWRGDAVSRDRRARHRLYGEYVSTHLPHEAGAGIGPSRDQRRSRVFHKMYAADLPSDRTVRILDLGCGHGAFLAYLRESGYENAIGVDASAEQVSLALDAGLPVERGDVLEFLATSTEHFGLITAFDLLEHLHLDETLELVDLVHRALAPGGAFVFQSACAEGPFGSRYRYGDLTHTTAFTARSASQLLRVAGFVDIMVRPVRPVVVDLTSAARHLVWRLGEWSFRLLLAAETGERQNVVLTQNLIATAWKSAYD